MLHIVVVLFRSADAVRTLWDCLQAQSFAEWRIVAVDNGAADDAGAFLAGRGDPRVRLHVNTSNEGFARGVNRGLRLAVADGAERLLLLNPDVRFDPDFLLGLMAQWTTHRAEVIAPRIMCQENPGVAWYAGGSFDYGWVFSNRHEPYRPGDPEARLVEFASGCCLGLTRRTLQAIGLLDESFFVYWEDTDYCLRLKAAEQPVQYVAEPALLHKGGASSGGEHSPAAARLYYRSYAQLLKKHFGLRRALASAARVTAKECGRPNQAPGHGRRVASALLRGLLTALRPVPRLQAVPGPRPQEPGAPPPSAERPERRIAGAGCR